MPIGAKRGGCVEECEAHKIPVEAIRSDFNLGPDGRDGKGRLRDGPRKTAVERPDLARLTFQMRNFDRSLVADEALLDEYTKKKHLY
jgi:hypothetical protein